MCVVVVAYLAIRQQAIPDIIAYTLSTIVGYYFGTKNGNGNGNNKKPVVPF